MAKPGMARPGMARTKRMNDPVSTRSPASGRFPAFRLAFRLGLMAAVLIGTLPLPARADDHDHGRGNGAGRGPQRGHPQQQHRNGGYNREPDMYYTAPPVVYLPPTYYQQPGASLSIVIPLFR
jgi:hypothetical protein